jgi:tripeptidyl-peptidase-1
MALTSERYHVPEHIRHHIDYVTPGVKGLGVSQPRKVEKRLFGLKKPTPPLLKALPMPIGDLLKYILDDVLDICDATITPDCIKSKRAPRPKSHLR